MWNSDTTTISQHLPPDEDEEEAIIHDIEGLKDSISSLLQQDAGQTSGNKILFSAFINKKKHDHIDHRLLIITQYRLYTLKKGVMNRLSIRQSIHIYDLVEISSIADDQVKFEFQIPDKTKGSRKDWFIDIYSLYSDEIVRVIRRAYTRLSFMFPLQSMFKLDYPSNRLYQIKQPAIGDFGNYLLCYDANCNRFREIPNENYGRYIRATAQTENPFVIDLGHFHRESSQLQLPELSSYRAVLEALKFNSHFKELLCADVPSKDFITRLPEIVAANTRLEVLEVRRLDALEGFVALGEAFGQNPNPNLHRIVLSELKMKERGILALAQGLDQFAGELVSLDVSQCAATDKAVAALVDVCLRNKGISKYLRELNVAENKLDSQASDVLSSLVSDENCQRVLEILNVSNTGIKPDLLLSSLAENGSHCVLRELHLGGLIQTESSITALTRVCNTVPSIEILDVSGNSLSAANVAQILDPFVHCPARKFAIFDVSGNCIGEQNFKAFSDVLKESTKLRTLNLANNKMDAYAFQVFANVLEGLHFLEELSLADNGPWRRGEPESVADHISAILRRRTNLKVINISSRDEKSRLGDVFRPIALGLSETKIRFIDAKGHYCGDDHAEVLVTALRENRNFVSLKVDDNNFSPPALKKLMNAALFHANLTLFPLDTDIARAIAKGKDNKTKEATAHSLRDIASQLAAHLNDNIKTRNQKKQALQRKATVQAAMLKAEEEEKKKRLAQRTLPSSDQTEKTLGSDGMMSLEGEDTPAAAAPYSPQLVQKKHQDERALLAQRRSDLMQQPYSQQERQWMGQYCAQVRMACRMKLNSK
eukprot:GCRY01005063.1.p1 GENE.GCRY01005063.1~~GCRY01005063.1.p1  ORF type:complete len:825 (+),score=213.39 GCRY01005063.1:259-2733(+)